MRIRYHIEHALEFLFMCVTVGIGVGITICTAVGIFCAFSKIVNM